MQSGPERSRARFVRRSEPLTARTARPPFRSEGRWTDVRYALVQSNTVPPKSFSRYYCRHPSIRTLDERFLRSVQVGCSRFSRCCHLIIDLWFHLDDGSLGQAFDAVTGTRRLNFGLLALCFLSPWIETTPRPATRLLAGCAVVRKLLHRPTADATAPPAFAPLRSPLVSSHSFLLSPPV